MAVSFHLQDYVVKRAKELGYSLQEILSKRRHKSFMAAKHLIILELRDRKFSLSEITNFFGYSDVGQITHIQRKFGRRNGYRKQQLNTELIVPSTL